MSGLEIGFISLGLMLVLIYSGLHVPIALALSSFLGVWMIRGSSGLASKLIAIAAEESISSYIFGVVPLFVLMGLVVSEAGLGRDAFDVASQTFGKIKGGLGVATVFANAIFAAITGISIASAAIFTRIAVPEMRRSGYEAKFAVGIVAGSSVLGMLIPPSLLLILYGVLSEVSVGSLFLAGILPGILLSLAYAIATIAMAYFWPSFVGKDLKSATEHLGPKAVISKLFPIMLLIILVLGGIYGGFFTPTEAGAIGAFASIVIALAKRRLPLKALWKVAVETGHITASICFLIISASMYSRMLALSGVPNFVGNWVTNAHLGIYGFIAIYVIITIIMGTILDSSSIMLVLLPLVLPIAVQFGINLVWFGIITIIAIEIGLLTPPLGIAVYVIKGSLDDQSISLNDIFAGALPFAFIMLLVLIIIIAVPWLSLALV